MNEQDQSGMVAGEQGPGADAGGVAGELDRSGILVDALRKARLAVIDTETTGFRVDQGARAIEVAIVRLWNLEPVTTFATLIDCVDAIPAEATKVHGITLEQTRGGFDNSGTWGAVTSVLRSVDAFVFHNAAFDLPFIAEIVGGDYIRSLHGEIETAEFRSTWLRKPVIDTLGLARALRGTAKNNLAQVARDLAVTQESAHRALGDVLMTARILPILASQYEARYATALDQFQRGSTDPNPLLWLAAESEEAMRRSEASFGRKVDFRKSAGLT